MVSAAACVPSDLLPYVYHYLEKNGYSKSAKSLKKQTGTDLPTPAGPDLVEIFDSFYQQQKDNSVVIVEPEPEKETDEDVQKLKKKKKKRKAEDNIDVPEVKKLKKEKVKKEESSDEEEVKATDKKVKKEKKSKKDKTKKKKKAESESESEEENNNQVETTNGKEEVEAKTNKVETKNDDENVEAEEETYYQQQTKQTKNAPFRRVISEDVFVRNSLQDNSFEGKIGSRGDWGEKANLDLKHTRGKGFRHEKTKKKRGSYKGGAINTSVNSIKFDDSD